MRIEYIKLDELEQTTGCTSVMMLVDKLVWEMIDPAVHGGKTKCHCIIMAKELFDKLVEDVPTANQPRHLDCGGKSLLVHGVYNGCYLFISGTGPGEYDPTYGHEELFLVDWPVESEWLVLKVFDKEKFAKKEAFAKKMLDDELKLKLWECDEYTWVLAPTVEEANRIYLAHQHECHGDDLSRETIADSEQFSLLSDDEMKQYVFADDDGNRSYLEELTRQLAIDPVTPRVFAVSD